MKTASQSAGTQNLLSRSGRGREGEESLTVTVEQAAALLGIGRRTAYKAMAHGTLPALRLGVRLVVPRAKLYQMLGVPAGFPDVER
jgi:excisionase family DNA binding protein